MFNVDTKLFNVGNDFIKYYIVPWDSEIFGYNILEIKVISTDSNKSNNLAGLINHLDSFCNKEKVRLVCCKVPIYNNFLIDSMQDYGFKYVESSIVPYINLSKINKEQYQSYCHSPVRKAREEDIKTLQQIAKKSFKYDRFHMDSKIDNNKADNRYAYWVENSFKDNESIYVILWDNRVAGFYIIKVYDKNYTSIRLGCISPEFQGKGLGRNIHAEILLELKQNGLKELDTGISINNTEVLNLYASMGFKFKDQKVAFHKWFF